MNPGNDSIANNRVDGIRINYVYHQIDLISWTRKGRLLNGWACGTQQCVRGAHCQQEQKGKDEDFIQTSFHPIAAQDCTVCTFNMRASSPSNV
jgi:hypothetical protein